MPCKRSYRMEFRNRAIVPNVAGALCVAATSAMAQVGDIPDRNGLYGTVRGKIITCPNANLAFSYH